VAGGGDVVLLSNGLYALSLEIVVSNEMLIKSLNGLGFVIVDGGNGCRCFSLSNCPCVLSGLTITNGWTDQPGAGVYCGGSVPVITNCVVAGNHAGDNGGGVCNGTVNNCIITGNWTENNRGGGVFGGTVNNCTIIGNQSKDGGGASHCRISNSKICYNEASDRGSGGGTFISMVTNCTIIGNSAWLGGGTWGGALRNCIVIDNTDSQPGSGDIVGNNVSFCCSPDLTHGENGNITNAPMFVDVSATNYHLLAGSPCVDAGTDLSGQGMMHDFDGIPRPLDGDTNGVASWDIGCYEYVHPGADSDSDGLLDTNELYGIGTNPADADTDDDGLDDGDELIADTDPCDAGSVLWITNICPAGAWVRLDWQGGLQATQWLETTMCLTNDDWSAIFTNLPPTSSEESVIYLGTNKQGIFRIKAGR